MISPGSRLGRYDVVRLLGVGGMGEVYLATDRELGRQVALKVLPAEVAHDAARRERLELEAKSASALNHPNIVTVYEIGTAQGALYLATEMVVGVTLRQRLEVLGGRLPLSEVVQVAAQVAAALAAAGDAGIVHRDVKPENVMLRPDGWVKVLDFGLSRPVGDAPRRLAGGEPLSRPTILLGTLGYMAPELIREQPLDQRADLWSLGVVLYELATGYLPFGGLSPGDVLASILRSQPPRLADLPGGPFPEPLQAIVDRCLAKRPRDRFADARELLAALRGLGRALGVTSDPLPLPVDLVPAGGVPRVRSSGGALAGADTALLARPLDAAPNNLPTALRPFVGRRDEIATTRALLAEEETRLVTLTGPGGVGKTRLALQVAGELLAWYPDGVYLVELASRREANELLPAIAATLGVQEAGGLALASSLAEHLRGRRMLLLLDNLEQLPAVGGEVAALLRAVPGLVALATSRAPLGIFGEREVVLRPLPVPSLASAPAPLFEAVAASPAVALFLDRARAGRPELRLGRDNAGVIAAICARLDGLPLAIELAAARSKLLPPAAMLARLDRPLELLTGGARDLPERQRTLRDALLWSYQLLDGREQALFRQLSVFESPFDLADAAAVLALPEHEPRSSFALLDALGSLADQSLLEVVAGSEEPRFTMLASLRELGQEQLSAAGELLDTAARHAAHVLARVEVVASVGAVADEAALAALAARHADVRAALDWALATGETALAVRLAAAVWWLWYLHGHYSEGRRRLAAVLAAAELPGVLDEVARRALPRALLGAGTLAFLQCDYEPARDLLAAARAAAKAVGDARSEAEALQAKGSVAREEGNYPAAWAHHQAARERFAAVGDERGVARADNYLAFVGWLTGDWVEAGPALERAAEAFARLDDPEGRCWVALNRAAIALWQGELVVAQGRADRALVQARESGFREGVAWALELQGTIRRQRGEHALARRLLAESLLLHRTLGDRWRMASVLEGLAGCELALDRPPVAARLLGAAEALREGIGAPVPPVEAASLAATRAALAARLPAAELTTARTGGRQAAVEEVVAAVRAAVGL